MDYSEFEDTILYLCYCHFMDSTNDGEVPTTKVEMMKYIRQLSNSVKLLKTQKEYCFH